MTNMLTDAQIAQHAYAAGFRGDALNTAIAVALAESRGDADALGDIGLQTRKWGPSVGLWQIRSLNDGYGTAREQQQRDQTANTDPATNARNAYAISNQGTDWGAWTTYTSNRHQGFLDRARAASAAVPADQVVPTPTPRPPAEDVVPTPTPNPRRTGEAPDSEFRAAPRRMRGAASEISDQAGRIKSVHSELSGIRLPADAFGLVPESRVIASAQANSLSATTHKLAELVAAADKLSSGVKSSADNYELGDDSVAAAYRQLFGVRPIRQR